MPTTSSDYVLWGARASFSNLPSTAPPTQGVSRSVVAPPAGVYPTSSAARVAPRVEMYRTRLEGPRPEVEYLVWAATGGSFESNSGTSASATITIPTGTLAVIDGNAPGGVRADGTASFFVEDAAGLRRLETLTELAYIRGDTGARTTWTVGAGHFTWGEPTSTVHLEDVSAVRTAVGVAVGAPVAVSEGRGDRLEATAYTLRSASFWWTRNDSNRTRFELDGENWSLKRGESPLRVGVLGETESFRLPSVPPSLSVGSYFPGSPLGDAWAAIRVGAAPNATSYPVVVRSSGPYTGLRVVEESTTATYNWAGTTPPAAGVVGSETGSVTWNPAFESAYSGQTVWYSPPFFRERATGEVGSLEEASWYLAPVPQPGETPVLRIGNRAPLEILAYDTESELSGATILPGQAAVAYSTGRVRLSEIEVDRARSPEPGVPNADFDPSYWKASLRYEGVTLNSRPQPLRPPCALVDETGAPVSAYTATTLLYIPDARELPGLGRAGVLALPDGTGNAPLAGTPTARPGATHCIRALDNGIGESYLFSNRVRTLRLEVVELESQLPTDPYALAADTAHVALERNGSAGGARVVLSSGLMEEMAGGPIYFAQTEFTPARYSERGRLTAQFPEPYVLQGTETLALRAGSQDVTWSAATLGAGSFTATAVAAAIQVAATAASAPMEARAREGFLEIVANPISTSIAVGWARDGAAALGLVPGWCAQNSLATGLATDPNWLPDTGVALGLYRSEQNLDGRGTIPDTVAERSFLDQVEAPSLTAQPVFLRTRIPRDDRPGYGTGLFYSIRAERSAERKLLLRWKDWYGQNDQLGWLELFSRRESLSVPHHTLELGRAGVVEGTLAMGVGGRVAVAAAGGAWSELTVGEDVILDSLAGTVEWVRRVGSVILTGGAGHYSATSSTFTDSTTTFTSTVQPGDRLEVKTGTDAGWYRILSVASTSLIVSPPFSTGDVGRPATWAVSRGAAPNTLDSTRLADVAYVPFSPSSSEPFQVWRLDRLGEVGGVWTAAPSGRAPAGVVRRVRFGAQGAEIPCVELTSQDLGAVEDVVLRVPTTDSAWVWNAWALRIGSQEFTQGVNLIGVTSFSADPGAVIQYLTTGTPGALKLGSAVLAAHANSRVRFEQRLPAANSTPLETALFDSNTGIVRVATATLAAHPDTVVYFATRARLGVDVDANPIAGSFTWKDPMRAGQLVEVQYWRAVPDTGARVLVNGAPVYRRELLPVFRRREVATRINDRIFRFNLDEKTTVEAAGATVYAGARQLTYGTPSEVSFDWTANTLTTTRSQDVSTTVTVTYAVLEAEGGETTYTIAQPPAWRPPFYLAAGQTTFTLEGDRRSECSAGRMLLLGGTWTTYIRASTYASGTNLTTVTLFPAPDTPRGSLAPSSDAGALLTDRPITPVVDPASATPVTVTHAAEAFLLPWTSVYGGSGVPRFKSLVRGATRFQIEGNFTRYAVAGHVVELDGIPYLLRGSELSDDGRLTTLQLAAPTVRGWTWSSSLPAARMRISVRPVYPSSARTFLGTPFHAAQPFTLIRWENATTPGRTLLQGRDYSSDPSTGILHLLESEVGLRAGEILEAHRTERVILEPVQAGDQILYPRVDLRGAAIAVPSEENGLLGATLHGRYTYDAPDRFYVRVTSLAAQEAEQTAEENGAVSVSRGGIASRGSALADAQVLDRAARAALETLHRAVNAWEQTVETFRGEAVGERDGRLKFSVGRGNWWNAAGYEDPITGTVAPRYLWASVWAAARSGLSVLPWTPEDPLLIPRTATDAGGGVLSGTSPDAATFRQLLEAQKKYVLSDLEDIAVSGVSRVERRIAGFFYFSTRAWASYRSLGEGGALSRLFPERTRTYTTLAPGLGATSTDAGVYTAGRMSLDLSAPTSLITFQSTNDATIGQLENSTLGPVTNVTGVTLRMRRARARVLGWFPVGWVAAVSATAGRPTLWVSVVPSTEFPIASSGLPDFARLASQSGTPIPTGVWDASTGHVPLHTPPWTGGEQVALGTASGQVYEVGWRGAVIGGRYAGVFVDQVHRGCLITLKSQDASGTWIPLTDAQSLVRLTGPLQGVPLEWNAGDTLLSLPATGSVVALSDPPTAAELEQINATLHPPYRAGTDYLWVGSTGALLDATLPSFSDPTLFGFKEITGQNPPPPLSTVEAEVSFQNVRVEPIEVPALLGQTKLDCGDYSAPYFQFRGELELLSSVQEVAIRLKEGDSPESPPSTPSAVVEPYAQEALYPDEVVDDDGSVSADDAVVAGSLYTVRSLNASASLYPTPGHAGVGKMRPYDLFLVEPNSGGVEMPAGFAGIHTVGAVTFDVGSARVEPPRFVSAVNLGTAMSWVGENLQVSMTAPTYTVGVVVTADDTVSGAVVTTFDVSSVSTTALVLDNGTGGGLQTPPIGGWNEVLSKCAAGTVFRFDLIEKTTGLAPPAAAVRIRVVTPGASILATTFEVSGDGGLTYVAVNAGGLSFFSGAFTVVSANPFFNFAPFNPVILTANVKRTGSYHDFRIGVSAIRSTVVSVEDDRLTFGTPLDLRSARPRGTRHPASLTGEILETRLATGTMDYRVVDSTTGLNTLVTTSLHDVAQINAAVSFTFAARARGSPSTYDVGTFSGGRGTLRAMATEGAGNIAWSGTGIHWAALPSSRQNETGPLFSGMALVDSVSNLPYNAPLDGRFVFSNLSGATPVYSGSLANVEPGDLVVIRSALDAGALWPTASGKAGTYLVRAAVPWDDATRPLERRATYSCSAEDESGWVRAKFPKILAASTGTLTVETTPTLPVATNLTGTPAASGYGFSATGRVWVLANESALGSTHAATYGAALYSAAYTAYNGSTGVFSGLSDYRDGLYNTVTSSAWNAAAQVGRRVSGMTRVPVEIPRSFSPGFLPGYTSLGPGTLAVYGVRSITAARGTSSITYAANASGTLTGTSPGTLRVYQHSPQLATEYLPLSTPIYSECIAWLEWGELEWDAIHTTGAFVPAGARCVLPGDSFSLQYSAAAGIFVELSFPRTGGNYGSSFVRVVDRDHTLHAANIGPRRLPSYTTLAPSSGQAFYEYAQLEVRRVRRWSRCQTALYEPLSALRYANEIRRGLTSSVVEGVSTATFTATAVSSAYQPTLQVGGAATQLGALDDPRVGIGFGDTVVFGANPDAPLATTRVIAVRSAFVLEVESVAVSIPSNTPFQIWIRRAPVPQEQSAEEMRRFLEAEEILRRTPNYATGAGGRVAWGSNADAQVAYDTSVNRLRDGDLTVNYVAANVRVGDLVVVDSAGLLQGPTGVATPPEYGAPPHGDRSVLGRSGVYEAGGPLRGDDNRGVYRVENVTASELRVGAVAGVLSGTRTGGDSVVGVGAAQWTWLPTVHGSWLSGSGTGREGQGDLRPTERAATGSNSVSSSWRSIEPFGYRIVRPRSDVDARTLEAAYLFRERTLTWLETLRPWVEIFPIGTYDRFQALGQVNSLETVEGTPGVGCLRNGGLERLGGVWNVTPYASESTERVWMRWADASWEEIVV